MEKFPLAYIPTYKYSCRTAVRLSQTKSDSVGLFYICISLRGQTFIYKLHKQNYTVNLPTRYDHEGISPG